MKTKENYAFKEKRNLYCIKDELLKFNTWETNLQCLFRMLQILCKEIC